MPFGNYRGIASGPDGRLWFVDKDGDKIVAMTPQGAATAYQLAQGSTPEEIIAGPDGNMWVTLFSRHGVARITPAGAISEFLLPTSDGQPVGHHRRPGRRAVVLARAVPGRRPRHHRRRRSPRSSWPGPAPAARPASPPAPTAPSG